jgi:TRAP-type transport system small permease protein
MLKFQQAVARTSAALATGLYVITSAILAAMVVLLFLQVTLRYGMMISLPWTEEIARFLLVWFSLLASCVAAHLGQHFAFVFLVSGLPPSVRAIVVAIVLLANVLVVGTLTVYCYHYLSNLQGLYSTATGIDMRLPYASLPVSYALLTFMFAAEFIDTILGSLTGHRFSRWQHLLGAQPVPPTAVEQA